MENKEPIILDHQTQHKWQFAHFVATPAGGPQTYAVFVCECGAVKQTDVIEVPS